MGFPESFDPNFDHGKNGHETHCHGDGGDDVVLDLETGLNQQQFGPKSRQGWKTGQGESRYEEQCRHKRVGTIETAHVPRDKPCPVGHKIGVRTKGDVTKQASPAATSWNMWLSFIVQPRLPLFPCPYDSNRYAARFSPLMFNFGYRLS